MAFTLKFVQNLGFKDDNIKFNTYIGKSNSNQREYINSLF